MKQRMFEAPITNSHEKGWECPKCGKINSPSVKTCSCTKPKVNEAQEVKKNWISD